MDYLSSGHPGDASRRLIPGSGAGPAITDLSSASLPSVANPQNQKGIVTQWADKTAIWGARDLASEVVNQKIRTKSTPSKIPEKPGIAASTESVAGNAAKSYSEIFRLGETQVPANALTWTQYQETVKSNLREFARKPKPSEFSSAFKSFSPGGYVKNTLIGHNFQPMRDVMRNHPNAEIGTALFRTATFGVMGFDIMKHTRDVYRESKAREDGTLRSKVHTWRDTGVAFGKYAVRDIASWEAASIGAAVGKAVIPVALGGISMGGIAVGAVAGLAAQKGLNAVLKTGDHARKTRMGPDGKPLPEYSLEKGMNPVVG